MKSRVRMITGMLEQLYNGMKLSVRSSRNPGTYT